METQKTIDGYTIHVQVDEWALSPRKEEDHLGVMCLTAKRYDLPWENKRVDPNYPTFEVPDEDNPDFLRTEDCGTWDDIELALRQSCGEDEIIAILPVFMLDHSGQRLAVPDPIRDFGRLDPFRHYYMGWDSFQVGFIYTTRERVNEYLGVDYSDAVQQKVDDILRGEVAQYDAYLCGDVYEWVIQDANGEYLESNGGYDDPETALAEAEQEVQQYLSKRITRYL